MFWGAGGYLIVFATSGDNRCRIVRFGSGRIGRSGNSEEVESGDIFSEYPVRGRNRVNVSHTAMLKPIVK